MHISCLMSSNQKKKSNWKPTTLLYQNQKRYKCKREFKNDSEETQRGAWCSNKCKMWEKKLLLHKKPRRAQNCNNKKCDVMKIKTFKAPVCAGKNVVNKRAPRRITTTLRRWAFSSCVPASKFIVATAIWWYSSRHLTHQKHTHTHLALYGLLICCFFFCCGGA